MQHPPPFLCLPLSLPHLSPSAFFLSPPLHSPSLEGHKSGCRGKIWRQWELFSLESDCVEGIFGKLLFNISALCLHPPPPPQASLYLSEEKKPVDLKFGGHFAGCCKRRRGRTPIVLVVGWTCTGRWKPRSIYPCGTLQIYIFRFLNIR